MKFYLQILSLLLIAHSSMWCMDHNKNDDQLSDDESEEMIMKATQDGQYYVTVQATVFNSNSQPQRASVYLYLNRMLRAKKTIMLEPGKQEIVFIGLYFRLKSTDALETYLNANDSVKLIEAESNLTYVPLGSSIKG